MTFPCQKSNCTGLTAVISTMSEEIVKSFVIVGPPSVSPVASPWSSVASPISPGSVVYQASVVSPISAPVSIVVISICSVGDVDYTHKHDKHGKKSCNPHFSCSFAPSSSKGVDHLTSGNRMYGTINAGYYL